MSQVQQFYVGQNIFITGVTGFLGEVLLEKLIRSCKGIGTIYVLVRFKKGKSAQERVDALINHVVFDRLRNEYPEFSKKIVGITGDIGEDNLGLSPKDYERLAKEVSVIFHLAATVRFDEKLEEAVSINVKSVKGIVDLAKECKNLKAGIYVSTAYSNCIRKSIDEELYPAPITYDNIIKLVGNAQKNNWSEEKMDNFTTGLLGEWPNTYSFTKAVAEGVIAEYAKEMPFAVFRPSIVTNAYNEPLPGWLAKPMGPSGVMCAAGLGIVHVAIMDVKAKSDFVPVDYVCNAMISCAWDTANNKRRSHEDVPVYNYVSGNKNPLSWGRFFTTCRTFGFIYPTKKAIYRNTVILVKSKLIYAVLALFLEIIPALMIDGIGKFFGKKIGLYNIVRKVGDTLYSVGYFSTQQWEFKNDRIQNLWKRIGTEDRQRFPFDIQSLDWDEYFLKMVKGLRKFIFLDPEGNEAESRRKHFYLHMIHRIVCLTFYASVFWITWKIFCGRSFTLSF